MYYFMNRENVENYKKMMNGYDSNWIMENLSNHVEKGKKILELGMGTGVDYEMMIKKYSVLGTDNSPLFIEDYKNKNPKANVQLLDATDINLTEKFDCVFSNKVLQHLTKSDFICSIKEQYKVLNHKGKIFMTLWYGKHEEMMMFDGAIRITYYEEKDIESIVLKDFDIVEMIKYTELEKDDSILVVLEKKSQ